MDKDDARRMIDDYLAQEFERGEKIDYLAEIEARVEEEEERGRDYGE